MSRGRWIASRGELCKRGDPAPCTNGTDSLEPQWNSLVFHGWFTRVSSSVALMPLMTHALKSSHCGRTPAAILCFHHHALLFLGSLLVLPGVFVMLVAGSTLLASGNIARVIAPLVVTALVPTLCGFAAYGALLALLFHRSDPRFQRAAWISVGTFGLSGLVAVPLWYIQTAHVTRIVRAIDLLPALIGIVAIHCIVIARRCLGIARLMVPRERSL